MLKKAPKLKEWAEKYLKTVDHSNTRRRYESSKENLVSFFGEGAQLDHLSTARIEQYKQQRREAGVKGSTINRDLRFLAQILKQAERERCLARSPFDLTKFFLNESRDRRKPHILTWEEQEKLLAVASPRIRMLTVLGVETGMRTGEMLALRWKDVDLLNDVLQVRSSKTSAGIRAVPISAHCRTELLRWRNLIGPRFSEWVFPNFEKRRHPFTARWQEGLGEHIEESGIAVFPNLLPASHVCLPADYSRCVAADDRSNAGTLIDTDRPQVCTGNGSEPAGCNEEVGRAEKIGDYQPSGGS